MNSKLAQCWITILRIAGLGAVAIPIVLMISLLSINAHAATKAIRVTAQLGDVSGNPVHACIPALNGIIPANLACYDFANLPLGAFSKTEVYDMPSTFGYWIITCYFIGTYFANADAYLKFQILGVDYAPPGSRSTVTYGGNTMLGTSTTNTQSWATDVSLTATSPMGQDFGGSTVVDYTQSSTSTSSNAITITDGNTEIIPGPASSAAGVDHDYDVIWVWLNPIAELQIYSSTNLKWQYAYNPEDDADEMEVIPLYVIWLKNPSLIPSNVAARLARSWDTTGLGGLTAADYATILAADPFADNSAFNPNTDTSGRFDLEGGETISYEPPPAGGQPITSTQTESTQITSTLGQSATHSYSVAVSATQMTPYVNFTESGKYTTTDGWSSIINNGTTKTASLSITGPSYSDDYTGPTVFQVWRDNVYGSYMFYPVQ